ncbi:hypothetical protein CMU99_16350 [Elizabethkingia anophelis]|nr:hypothetical protein [Elizabethkingia anophelis]
MNNITTIPEGIPNLKDFFPIVYLPDVEEWKIQALSDNDEVLMTTKLNKIDCCSDVRLHFVNSFGQLDAINFKFSDRYQETKSSVWEKPKDLRFDYKKGGRYRQDIVSENYYELETPYYLESELPYLEELVNSPLVFIEKDIDNGFNKPTSKEYIPFIIDDSKFPQKSSDDPFEFKIQLKGRLANQRINFR